MATLTGEWVRSGSRLPLDIVRLTEADWRTLAEVRLRALRDSPAAFPVDCEKEQGRVPQEWRDRLADSDWVVARRETDGEIVGLAHLTAEPKPDHGPYPPAEVRYIESVWVAPSARRQGVSQRMIQALEAQARQDPQIRSLLLWVLAGNHVAWNVYQRLGFVPTRERKHRFYTSDATYVWERRMRKML
ncbi:GNAT family N-acetyltransferase [Kineosporia sp. NBRC 101731]|uniref:GNAT family N-acetyltransferase n=1 Tax=Kineosporia sp. NBRC 101731 TaxID=3032199 RepID=UPI00249FAD1E|nr:GNAT family N-acetyltransferase [Kineosporia sp. NBRC 101731]GLY31337.1 N-acetyltransferase [Kineosporia sp. NBRC 101731]